MKRLPQQGMGSLPVRVFVCYLNRRQDDDTHFLPMIKWEPKADMEVSDFVRECLPPEF